MVIFGLKSTAQLVSSSQGREVACLQQTDLEAQLTPVNGDERSLSRDHT